jgi:hypothetical protein
MGQRAGEYLRWKRGRLTDSTYRDYEACLDKLARFFARPGARRLRAPCRHTRLEEFLDASGGRRPRARTTRTCRSSRTSSSGHAARHLHGDPALSDDPAQEAGRPPGDLLGDDPQEDLADGPGREPASRPARPSSAARLRAPQGRAAAGAVQALRPFAPPADHLHEGREDPRPPDPRPSASGTTCRSSSSRSRREPSHFLLPPKQHLRGYDPDGSSRFERKVYPDKPMGAHGLHDWWYGCLQRAGIVARGRRRGEKMHKARHTAGQRVLDKTGNLKAVQKLSSATPTSRPPRTSTRLGHRPARGDDARGAR